MPPRAAESEALRPRDADELAEMVRASARPLEPVGSGSMRAVGAPVVADVLDLAALAGIVDYEPAELILTARAATALDVIADTLEAQSQRLAFEPPDFARLLGGEGGRTLGGVLATNLAGSRRVYAGAARDHFLGCRAVDGRGVSLRAGGKVVKNVSGFDLPKLLAGSWGTLAVLTEVTVRVAPAPEADQTLLLPAADVEDAARLMQTALATPVDVSAAAYEPARACCGVRLEGLTESVAARAASLLAALDREAEIIEGEASRAFWKAIGAAEALAEWPVVWRLSVPPADAARVVAAIAPECYLLDWGGGLIWAGYGTPGAASVRAALAEGHATLFKAPPAMRAQVPVFQPPPVAVAAIGARIKEAFDPHGKLNPGRMQ